MSPTGTSLVVFKQALVAVLQGRPGLAAATVTYEYPWPNPGPLAVWIGDADADTRVPVMRAGTKKVDEDYTVTVMVQALKTQGEGQEAADLAALALLQEVQQQLAETPQVTPEIQWALFAGWSNRIGPFGIAEGGNTGRGSRFEIRVSVRARLS